MTSQSSQHGAEKTAARGVMFSFALSVQVSSPILFPAGQKMKTWMKPQVIPFRRSQAQRDPFQIHDPSRFGVHALGLPLAQLGRLAWFEGHRLDYCQDQRQFQCHPVPRRILASELQLLE